jgi:RNA polymerase sigma-70 factor (TIGR02960 family)
VTTRLEAARTGDEQAFRELTAPFLRELHVHCYRMLGSVDDADDVLQESLLAVWRGLDGYEGRSSLRVWLYRIATTRCLNAIRDRSRRPRPVPVPPFHPPEPTRRQEVTWLQPYPDDPSTTPERRETIELAFITALQTLPPRQTAALLLCDVLDFAPTEVADLLGAGATAVKGLLQRARAALATRPAPMPAGPDEQNRLAQLFAAAYTSDDVPGLVELLTDETWLAMPPAPHVYIGTTAVAEFLRASLARPGRGRVHLAATRANQQPAFGVYLAGAPTGIVVLTVGAHGITGITRFLDDRMHRRFDLPDLIG